MKIALTLDYELFLGSKTGSVEKCLINPMRLLSDIAINYGAVFTIFVDATYLYMLKSYSRQYKSADQDYKSISDNLCRLQSLGHDIQLHIHPHWFFSTYNGSEWKEDHEHYKLCDLSIKDAKEVFKQSKSLIDEMLGKETEVFRAGGFSTQPTQILTELMDENHVLVDSSVCPNTYYNSQQQKYDYRVCPEKEVYRFCEDICVENDGSKFMEVPISMYKVSPFFYWRLVFARLLRLEKHQIFGDGISVRTVKESIIERLTTTSYNMVTIDGIKSSFLKDAYKWNRKRGKEILCVLGHPKLATPYSVIKFREFCECIKASNDHFIKIRDLYE